MNNKQKTLGKTSSKLLTTLASEDRNIFTVSDAIDVIGGTHAATRRLLSDLVKKKWLIRLQPGKYLIVPLSAGPEGEHSENWHLIARYLIEPSPYYISHYSALELHEMITQPLFTVFVSSPTRKATRKILGASFRFIYIKPQKMWGIDTIWVTPNQAVSVSDLERTIIDCLDRPELAGGISEVAKGLWARRNDLDLAKLVGFARRFGKKSVAKRLGYLLEIYGLLDEAHLPELKNLITPGYVSLDPSLPPSGSYKSLWKLRVNLDAHELQEITET